MSGHVQGVPPVQTVELAPGYRIPRIIRGGWQLAGDHGPVDRARAVQEIGAFVDAGLNTVDGADIYTGVSSTPSAARQGSRCCRCTPSSCPTTTTSSVWTLPMPGVSCSARCSG